MSNPRLKSRKYVCIEFNKGVLRMNKKNPTESTELAGRTFSASDYQKGDALSSGLATTHEQASDVYMEGVVGESADDVQE
jgi:BioD-like phosphotransacetylase family protein